MFAEFVELILYLSGGQMFIVQEGERSSQLELGLSPWTECALRDYDVSSKKMFFIQFKLEIVMINSCLLH